MNRRLHCGNGKTCLHWSLSPLEPPHALPLSALAFKCPFLVPSCCAWLSSSPSHISGHFQPPCIPLGRKDLRKEGDQKDRAIADMQKVSSGSSVKDQLQPRLAPTSNGWQKTPLPQIILPIGWSCFPKFHNMHSLCNCNKRKGVVKETPIQGPEHLS